MFSTSKEAYIWLLDKFIANKPDVLINIRQREIITSGRGGTYLAPTLKELFLSSPHLAEDPLHFERVSGGWFAITNLNNDVKFNVLCRFARITGLKYEDDWTWDDGSNRNPNRVIGPRTAKRSTRKVMPVNPSLALDLEELN